MYKKALFCSKYINLDQPKPMQTLNFIVLDYDPFGMITVGRNWTSGSGEEYRFGFNGKENSDEIYGDDNAVDFGDRIYNCRLGRWIKPDNYFKLYPSQSAYVFAVNNPQNVVDVDGNTIVPFNEYTREQLLGHFNRLFNAETAELLINNISMDGSQKTIKRKEFKRAIRSMSTEQKALARGYYKMINSNKKVLYAFGKADDDVPQEAMLDNFTIRNYAGKKFSDVSTGSGALSPSKQADIESPYAAAVIIQTDGNVDFYSGNDGASVFDKDGVSGGSYDKSKSDGFAEIKSNDGSHDIDGVIIHEGLGHALFGGIYGLYYEFQQFKSIQVENVYRRMKGYAQRTGIDDHHMEVEDIGGGRGAPSQMEGQKITDMPNLFKKL